MKKTNHARPSSSPLVIRISKGRRIGGLIFSIIASSVLGFPLILIIDPSEFNDPLAIIQQLLSVAPVAIFIVAYVGYSIRNMWWGETLILDEAGFRYKIYKKRGFVRWSDIKQFRLEAPLLGMRENLGWDYKDDQASAPHTHQRLRSQGKYPTSLHGDLGTRWQGGEPAVRDSLEAWRLRYGTNDSLVEPSIAAAGAKDMPDTMVIQSSHWKYLYYSFLMSIGWIVGLGTAYILSPANIPTQPSWWPAAGMALIPLALLGPITWILVRRYLSRQQITLKPSGFKLRDERGVRFTSWSDVGTFGLIYYPQSHRHTVGWRWKARTTANLNSADMDEDIGGGFEGDPEDLRDVLEDWRIRFS